MGRLVEMKIHYRKPTLLEQMDLAIRDCNSPDTKPIDHFELTQKEFNQHFSSFDKSHQQDGNTQYSFKSIPIKVQELNSNFNISGPIGSFVNHVRWLMLLDPLFSINLIQFNQEKYNSLKGPDWPSYENYVNKQLAGVSEEIKKKFDKMGAYLLEFDTVDNKIRVLKDKIYSESRTWHNWLIVEWTFRERLHKFEGVGHGMKHKKTSAKNLLLTIDPGLAHRCYLKFNSNLNNWSVDCFKKKIAEEVEEYKKMAQLDPTHYRTIASDVLYQPTLDRTFYNELIDWFNLTDNYEIASLVHQLWYAAHQRAEKEFVTDIREFYEN